MGVDRCEDVVAALVGDLYGGALVEVRDQMMVWTSDGSALRLRAGDRGLVVRVVREGEYAYYWVAWFTGSPDRTYQVHPDDVRLVEVGDREVR